MQLAICKSIRCIAEASFAAPNQRMERGDVFVCVCVWGGRIPVPHKMGLATSWVLNPMKEKARKRFCYVGNSLLCQCLHSHNWLGCKTPAQDIHTWAWGYPFRLMCHNRLNYTGMRRSSHVLERTLNIKKAPNYPQNLSGAFHQRNVHDPVLQKIQCCIPLLGTWMFNNTINSMFYGLPPPLTDKQLSPLLDPQVAISILWTVYFYPFPLFLSFPCTFSYVTLL